MPRASTYVMMFYESQPRYSSTDMSLMARMKQRDVENVRPCGIRVLYEV